MEATARPLAVVTGASSGIGLELAKVFAAGGYDLIVAAEDAGVHTAAQGIRDSGAGAEAVQVDLATEDGVKELYARIESGGRPVDAAALNAGIGRGGPFVENPLEDELEVIDLNVRGTTHLAKLVLRDMVARDAGRLLITSSIASTMPGSFQAVYNATKSYVQSLGLALREELKDSNVSVTLLMPGPTETEFFERADMLDTNVGGDPSSQDDPALVARQGYEALMEGEEQVIAGSASTKLQGHAGKVMPDRLKAKMHRRMAEPGSGDGG
ncbi:MAG TPA: SDR family NAD(P)-dependent oxidoreductase [Thermoleophilaceae bacterium]|jgi:short-subunit dehydrogenase